MEECLQYMKTLRSHMNDAEDQAAKISVEEQMQITTIQTLTKEIDLAKSETKRLKEDSDLTKNAKGDICSKILERQRKIAVLENDSSTLSQTLELIQQERVNSSTKLVEKRTSYGKIEEELNTKLKEQQEWLNSYKSSSKSGQHSLVHSHMVRWVAHDFRSGSFVPKRGTDAFLDDAYKNIVTKIDGAKAKFNNMKQMRSDLALERHKAKQSLEELKCRMENYEPKLRDMLSEALEEEVRDLMSDKSGEIEYQESMQSQIETIKEISHTVKCGCEEEYKVEVDLCV
ncbi:hypothetical protein L1987_30580 [Smallanthus sonchifolius]|uniref:Uncharacterized protein n=1 Tax=Smallanthus sonchifolius TaxID=185202 RepID=A0ACB9I2K0_9ASTR|nr:hypothetical protein L1987_30580 [Smallanthus sonchifolius]